MILTKKDNGNFILIPEDRIAYVEGTHNGSNVRVFYDEHYVTFMVEESIFVIREMMEAN